jgi:hypothetical protein
MTQLLQLEQRLLQCTEPAEDRLRLDQLLEPRAIHTRIHGLKGDVDFKGRVSTAALLAA